MVSVKLTWVDMALMIVVVVGIVILDTSVRGLLWLDYVNIVLGRPTITPEYFLGFLFLLNFFITLLLIITLILFVYKSER